MEEYLILKNEKKSLNTLIFPSDRDVPECSSDNDNCYQNDLNRIFYINRSLGCREFLCVLEISFKIGVTGSGLLYFLECSNALGTTGPCRRVRTPC